MTNPADALLRDGGATPIPSLRQALSVVRKRKWMILAIAVCVPSLVGLWMSKQPKRYEASTALVIDSTVPQYLGQNFRDVVEVASSWWTSQETMQTELKVLGSRSQAEAVARALCERTIGADKQPAMKRFVPSVDCRSSADIERAASVLVVLLRTEPVKDSRIVNLIVTYSDPEMAAFIANTMAQVYTQRNLERRLSQSEGAASWLGDEYGDLTEQLKHAENELVEFKKKNNVVAVGIEDQQNDLSLRRKKLAEELSGVQVKLIALRAQRDQLGGQSDPLNDARPGLSDSPVMMKLKELYVDQYGKLLELKGKYLDKHPTVIAQQARVESIRSDMQREAQLAAKNFEGQFQMLLKQERDLRVAVDSATHEALQLEQRAIEYNRLKRNFDRLQKISEQVGGREQETSLAGHLKTNNVRILDAAMVPTAAIAPNVPRAVAGSLFVALLLGFGLAFLLELLDTTVKNQNDVESTLGLTFLGLIPTIQLGNEMADPNAPRDLEAVRSGSKDLYVLAHPKSSIAECCRAIRTNLLFMSPDNPPRSLLVTSAGPQEGKTTSAVNLAVVMAQSGLRVLLVDTDMRRPRLHKAFAIPATSDGLSKVIVGEADVLQVVRDTGVPNLWLLPCGATPPNPAELLHAERFKRIVAELNTHYDRVIFDSPPVGAVTDAVILSRLTSGTILVAKAAATTREALARTRDHLTVDGAGNILGCILNDVDIQRHDSYGYHYYSKYGYYYNERSDEALSNPGIAG